MFDNILKMHNNLLASIYWLIDGNVLFYDTKRKRENKSRIKTILIPKRKETWD